MVEGTFNGTIYYKWNGVYYTRKKGNTGKQAPVAKQQASILGRASNLSAKIRTLLKPILPESRDRKLMYRMNNVLQDWLRTNPMENNNPLNEIHGLSGFCLYGQPELANGFRLVMPVRRSDNGNLIINIPGFDSPNPINPLPFSGTISLHFGVASCSVADASHSVFSDIKLEIPYFGIAIPPRQLMLPVQPLPGNLTVVALNVNDLNAGIVAAMLN